MNKEKKMNKKMSSVVLKDKIYMCSKCALCNNQLPLLDNNIIKADILWVGLSAKKVENVSSSIPLESNTKTGKIIEKIETDKFSFYKTNLVKCLPLNEKGKLRYPTNNEMESCFDNLVLEIEAIKPKIVFLLGAKVAKFTLKELNKRGIFRNIRFIQIYHPSYIAVYKRKEEDSYIKKIQKIINEVEIIKTK
jgi:DNA polymerase